MLTSYNSSDPTIIALDADKKVASIKALVDCMSALSFVHDAIKNDKLAVSTRYNGLGVAENQLKHISHLLNKQEDDRQYYELNKSELRVANEEINRLQVELAKNHSVEGIGTKLKELEKLVYDWWKSYGFLSVKGDFITGWRGEANYHAIMSCYLDPHGSSFMNDKPVTEKATKQQIIANLAKQVDLYTDGHEQNFADTERNRQFLIQIFAKRFLGCLIRQITSFVANDDDYLITELDVYIPLKSI